MGRDVAATVFTPEDRRRYRQKLRRCLDVFARMLREAAFDTDHPMVGLELELNLVDDDVDPAMNNAAVLEAIADPAWQTELAQFNVEVNLPPLRLDGDALMRFERDLRATLNRADAKAAAVGAQLATIGILPTLQEKHLGAESLSPNPRYALLDEQVLALRGEELHIAITGVERLSMYSQSVAPEAACTSVQFHVQVTPETFASYWNAAEAISSVQVALGANSPFLFGKELWRETRIPLFQQATDTRSEELKNQGVRPRVWFGERWINSVFDLFEENTRYFPALLPICDEEDPVEVLERGGIPQLGELTLHNGTIWRWNRPVYAVVDGTPHLRVENRVLPAGPTVADIVANGAFFFGLVRRLAEEPRPIWSRMPFAAARGNFLIAARHGIEAEIYWPGLGQVSVIELVLRRLLPLAHEGLAAWGVDTATRERFLGIIEGRCLTARNGAAWQAETVRGIENGGGWDRLQALRAMMRQYLAHMHSNEPVYTWPTD
jgi:gamma-glutamyl:cysteine ligase YbdK (ATP-grasp superfamily)